MRGFALTEPPGIEQRRVRRRPVRALRRQHRRDRRARHHGGSRCTRSTPATPRRSGSSSRRNGDKPLDHDVTVELLARQRHRHGGTDYTDASGTVTFAERRSVGHGARRSRSRRCRTATPAEAKTIPIQLTATGADVAPTSRSSSSTRTACRTSTRRCRSRSASPTCSSRMTLAEKIGQMTQAERGGLTSPVATSRPTRSARCCPAAARRRRRTRRRLGGHGRRLPGAGAVHAAADPADLRRRRRARPQQPRRRDDVPAQHRHRRHPRPGAGRAGGRDHGRPRRGRPASRGRSRRASAWRATSAGAARTSRSARTRRWSTDADVDRRPAGHDGDLSTNDQRAGHGQALRRRRRHDATAPRRTGSYTIDQGITHVDARRDGAAAPRRRSPAVEAGVGSIMPSYSSVDSSATAPAPIKMHADGDLITGVLKGDRLRRLRDQRLAGHRPDPGGDYDDRSASALGQRRHRHGRWSPYDYAHVHRRDLTAGRARRRADVADRRRRAARSSRRSSSSACSSTRSPTARNVGDVGSRRAPRGGPPGGRRVAGAAEERRRRAAAGRDRRRSTSPAPTPTTSATRPAAGRSPGRAHRATTTPARRSSQGIKQVAPDAHVTLQRDASAPIGRVTTSASSSSARRRTPRASGDVGNGHTARACRAADRAAVDKVCGAMKCVVLVVSGRPLNIAGDLGEVGRARRVVAAGHRGRRRRRRAVRRQRRSPGGCR